MRVRTRITHPPACQGGGKTHKHKIKVFLFAATSGLSAISAAHLHLQRAA